MPPISDHQLALGVFFGLGSIQFAQPRLDHLDRLGNPERVLDSALLAPFAAEGVFVTGPAFVAAVQCRPAAFAKHDFMK
jgi:hypothetical protein